MEGNRKEQEDRDKVFGDLEPAFLRNGGGSSSHATKNGCHSQAASTIPLPNVERINNSRNNPELVGPNATRSNNCRPPLGHDINVPLPYNNIALGARFAVLKNPPRVVQEDEMKWYQRTLRGYQPIQNPTFPNVNEKPVDRQKEPKGDTQRGRGTGAKRGRGSGGRPGRRGGSRGGRGRAKNQ